MTAAEITALRKELEDALFKAFTDFQSLTGVGIHSIAIDRIDISQIGKELESIVSGVSVRLESL